MGSIRQDQTPQMAFCGHSLVSDPNSHMNRHHQTRIRVNSYAGFLSHDHINEEFHQNIHMEYHREFHTLCGEFCREDAVCGEKLPQCENLRVYARTRIVMAWVRRSGATHQPKENCNGASHPRAS